MQPVGFRILYEQGPCLAVAKPAGLLTQAPPYIDSLERRVKEYLRIRDARPGKVYLGIPHRLDRPVSGILVMAKHARAAKRLSQQFERRMIEKLYWAWLEGEFGSEAGTWTDRVRKIPDQAQAEVVSEDDPEGRDAVLHYRVLVRQEARTLVEITLETGRYHQIRLQASHHRHPVVGDRLYGASSCFGPARDDERERSIALHARQLTFYHPMTREPVSLVADLPDYWEVYGAP